MHHQPAGRGIKRGTKIMANVKFLAGLALTAGLFVSNASAVGLTCSGINCVLQTVTIPSANTDINQAPALFNLFGSTAPGIAGDTLTGVTLEYVITETLDSLTLTNNTTTLETAKYTASAQFDCGTTNAPGGTGCDTVNATDGTALDAAINNDNAIGPVTLYNGATLTFTANQSYTTPFFTTLPKTLTEDTGAVLGTTVSYMPSGTFDLDYSTFSGFTVFGGGNNVLNSQDTKSAATAYVLYSYTVPSGVPEPASMFLLGSALIGLGFMRKRAKS
jgi:hypothetical protein